MSIASVEQGRVLIVEDNDKIRDMMLKYFSKHGFSVSTACDVPLGKNAIKTNRFDIVLLDIGLQGQDGLDVLREFGAAGGPGFIIVSGQKTIFDRVVGLELGADDYVTKPFSPRELMARVKAVLRRRRDTAGDGQRVVDRVATFAGWTFNLDCRQLINPDGSEVPLTTGEYNLLQQFVLRPGRALNRDQLMDLTRARDRNPFDRTIDAQVSRLRRKIECDSRRPQLIRSVHGTGYVFSCKVDWTRRNAEVSAASLMAREIEIAA